MTKTFKQFLTENSSASFEEFEKFLESASSQNAGLLDIEQFFYRGIKSTSIQGDIVLECDALNPDYRLSVYEIKINQKRRSADIANSTSDLINKWMEKNLGDSFRSKCVFTTRNFRQAASYATGSIGMVFPASNNAEWIFSPDIRDMYDEVDNGPQKWTKPGDSEYVEDPDAQLDMSWAPESIDRLLSSKEWIRTDDPSTIATMGEVMLVDNTSKNYYFVTITEKHTGKLVNNLSEFKSAFKS